MLCVVCEVWSLESKSVGIMECEMWTVKYAVQSVECKVLRVECGVQSVEYRVRSAAWSGEWGLGIAKCGVWSVEWRVGIGECRDCIYIYIIIYVHMRISELMFFVSPYVCKVLPMCNLNCVSSPGCTSPRWSYTPQWCPDLAELCKADVKKHLQPITLW